jgi:DNA-binding MarR family transcriptional regulator
MVGSNSDAMRASRRVNGEDAPSWQPQINVNIGSMNESPQLLGHDVGVAATRFHRVMRQAVQDALDPFDLSGTEYGALLYVERNPGSSNADLARFLLITPQALGRVTARLQERDLLVRDIGDARGRRLPLALSPAGGRALRAAEPAIEDAQRQLLSPLTPDQQAAFFQALNICVSHTDSRMKDFA